MADDLIKAAFTSAFKSAGFTKKASTWYKNERESILVANLQKSEFGDRYYLNLAVWYKALGDTQWPKEQHCHVRFRLSQIADGELDSLLNLDQPSASTNEHFARLQRMLTDFAVPRLQSYATLDGLRAALNHGELRRAFVHKQVKDVLGSTSP